MEGCSGEAEPTFWTKLLERSRLHRGDVDGDTAEIDSYSLTGVDYAKKAKRQCGPQHLNVKVVSAMSSCLVSDPMSTVILHSPGSRILELKKEFVFLQRVP